MSEILRAYLGKSKENPEIKETESYEKVKAEREITVSNTGYHYTGNPPLTRKPRTVSVLAIVGEYADSDANCFLTFFCEIKE